MPKRRNLAVAYNNLKPHNGFFSFNEKRLHKRIKAVKKDYDEDNPTTWPRIPLETITTACREKYDGSIALPRRLAYPKEIFETASKSRRRFVQTPTGQFVHGLFLDFPLNISAHGEVYDKPHLTDFDHGMWTALATSGQTMYTSVMEDMSKLKVELFETKELLNKERMKVSATKDNFTQTGKAEEQNSWNGDLTNRSRAAAQAPEPGSNRSDAKKATPRESAEDGERHSLSVQEKQDGLQYSTQTPERRSCKRKQAYVQSESMEELHGGKRMRMED